MLLMWSNRGGNCRLHPERWRLFKIRRHCLVDHTFSDLGGASGEKCLEKRMREGARQDCQRLCLKVAQRERDKDKDEERWSGYRE